MAVWTSETNEEIDVSQEGHLRGKGLGQGIWRKPRDKEMGLVGSGHSHNAVLGCFHAGTRRSEPKASQAEGSIYTKACPVGNGCQKV